MSPRPIPIPPNQAASQSRCQQLGFEHCCQDISSLGRHRTGNEAAAAAAAAAAAGHACCIYFVHCLADRTNKKKQNNTIDVLCTCAGPLPPCSRCRDGHVNSNGPFHEPFHTAPNAVKAKKEPLQQKKCGRFFHKAVLHSLILVGLFAVSLVRLLVQERVRHVARDLDLHEPPRAHGVLVQEAGCLRQGLHRVRSARIEGTHMYERSQNSGGGRRGAKQTLAENAHNNSQPVKRE